MGLMKVRENIHLYAWIEFFIWFVILCLVVLGVKHTAYRHYKEMQSFQIFLQDVDGLIVGSPVKYMGVQVGYIQKIKILSNEVYIKFIVTDKDLKLPQGAIATVEFSGMGGSKSLELYPPTQESISSEKFIVIKGTTRLNDSLFLLNEMFDKVGSITMKLSSFANDAGVLSTSKEQIDTEKIRENIKVFDIRLDEYNTDKQNFKDKMKELKDE